MVQSLVWKQRLRGHPFDQTMLLSIFCWPIHANEHFTSPSFSTSSTWVLNWSFVRYAFLVALPWQLFVELFYTSPDPRLTSARFSGLVLLVHTPHQQTQTCFVERYLAQCCQWNRKQVEMPSSFGWNCHRCDVQSLLVVLFLHSLLLPYNTHKNINLLGHMHIWNYQ